ncbi:MMPL family transporter [Paenibacillus sp. N4]|uniref:MMPL family transporter n=1 Tax=Paenibacillus vietnamensis TaxID=2590547 RepID=UPI001CD10604|nr:MMPL family transporter [Paenibacillus vietnamensis]MCA0758220.1 MMPL family transporter [Paenibacillus vietnamensis]
MVMERLARLSFRFPLGMILLWCAALIVAAPYAFRLVTVLGDHGLTPQGQYAEVQRMLAKSFGIPDEPVMLLFEKAEGVSDGELRRFIRQALNAAGHVPGLTSAASPLERPDMVNGNYAYALLTEAVPSSRMKDTLELLRRSLPGHQDISIRITGKPVVQTDVNAASHADLFRAELFGLPVAFLVMRQTLKGFAAALLPILTGISATLLAMGFLYALGAKGVELSSFVINVIPMVGLALSIDFALMLVSRFREELGRSSPDAALSAAMRTAGRAVVVSSACVFLGLLSFVWIPLPMFSSIALGAMAVLTASVVLTFTLLPALLAFAVPHLRPDGKPQPAAAGQPPVRHAFSRAVANRAAAAALLSAALLAACLLPLGGMRLVVPDDSSLPPAYESRAAAQTYRIYFEPPSTSRIWIVAEGELTGDGREKEAGLLLWRLEEDPAVLRVQAAALSTDGLLLQATIRGAPSSAEARSWAREWGKAGEKGPLPFMVGGEAKYEQEVFDRIGQSAGYVLLLLFASNFAVLLLAFRSVVIAVKTILMNLLTIGASFGLLTWLFENGRFGLEPGGIAVMIPVFVCGLVFGISMDYGVFLVSRIYEEYRKTGDNDYAVVAGLGATGRIITSAAAIMIAVTAPFAFGQVAGVRQLGIGIAAAILIDATLIRLVLMPSLMVLLGRWNWGAPRHRR